MKTRKKTVNSVNEMFNSDEFFPNDVGIYQKSYEHAVTDKNFKLSIEKVKSWLYSSKFVYPTAADAIETCIVNTEVNTDKGTNDFQAADCSEMSLKFFEKENCHNSNNTEVQIKKKISYLRNSTMIQNINCNVACPGTKVSLLPINAPVASKDKTSNNRAEIYNSKKLIEKLQHFQMGVMVVNENSENSKIQRRLKTKRKANNYLNSQVATKRIRLSTSGAYQKNYGDYSPELY
jgi:hypothetical protein